MLEAINRLHAALKANIIGISTVETDAPVLLNVTATVALDSVRDELRDFIAELGYDINDTESLSIRDGVAELVLLRKNAEGRRYLEIQTPDGEWVPVDKDNIWIRPETKDQPTRIAKDTVQVPYLELLHID